MDGLGKVRPLIGKHTFFARLPKGFYTYRRLGIFLAKGTSLPKGPAEKNTHPLRNPVAELDLQQKPGH